MHMHKIFNPLHLPAHAHMCMHAHTHTCAHTCSHTPLHPNVPSHCALAQETIFGRNFFFFFCTSTTQTLGGYRLKLSDCIVLLASLTQNASTLSAYYQICKYRKCLVEMLVHCTGTFSTSSVVICCHTLG